MMMKKHDETIQQLFDDYAEQLSPRQDLAERARMEMVERKAQPSASARRKSSFWVNFAWIAPVVAVFIAVVITLFSSPLFSSVGDLLGEDSTSNQPAVVYYTHADVKGRSASIDDYADALQIGRLKNYDYEVTAQRCYAFFAEDELRYVKVYLGIRSSNGTFTELDLVAEVDGYRRADLQEFYDEYSSVNGLGTKSGYDSSGEYVTKGYFAARNLHFYVVARNGQKTSVAAEILEIISA